MYDEMAAARLRKKGIELTSSDALAFAEGPTLKYYYPRKDSVRLSARRHLIEGENMLMVGSIVPATGRVLGVYRSIP